MSDEAKVMVARLREYAGDWRSRAADASPVLDAITLIERQQAEIERLRAIAQMAVDEYYGDDGCGDWQSIARAAKAALEAK